MVITMTSTFTTASSVKPHPAPGALPTCQLAVERASGHTHRMGLVLSAIARLRVRSLVDQEQAYLAYARDVPNGRLVRAGMLQRKRRQHADNPVLPGR